jgi:predicted GH43/DUF377 family glycosyl hydrolase
MSSPKLLVETAKEKHQTLFHRHAANPILTGKDWPYSEKCLVRGDSWMFAPEADFERHGNVQDVVFPCGYTVAADGIRSISTTVRLIRVLLWRTAASALF